MNTCRILVLFSLVFSAPSSFAQELSGGRRGQAQPTPADKQAQSVKESAAEADECGPIEDTASLLSYGQTAAVCSPGLLALGAQGIMKIAPVPAQKIISKIAEKAGTRAGLYVVGGAGVLLTLYDVASLIQNIKPSTVCDNDLELKKALIEKSDRIGKSIIEASEGGLSPYAKKKLLFSEARALETKSCNELYRALRKKKRYQEQIWTNTYLNNDIGPDKKERLKKAKIEGFHNDLIKNESSVSLSKIVSEASCLPLKTQVEIACAVGTTGVFGKVPAKKIIDKWTAQAKKIKKQKTAVASKIRKDELPFKSNYDADAKILAASKKELNQFEKDLDRLNLTPRQRERAKKELAKYKDEKNLADFSASESFDNLKLSARQKRKFYNFKTKHTNRSLAASGVNNIDPLSPREQAILKSPAVSVKQNIDDSGANDSYFVDLKNGYKGFFKPCRGSTDANNKCVNEVLAYKVDQKLGLDLVPETILKRVEVNGKTVSGSFQKRIDAPPRYKSDTPPGKAKDMLKQEIFDKVIANGDRSTGNFLVDKNQKVYSIDHGLSFEAGYGATKLNRSQKRFLKGPESGELKAKLNSMLDDDTYNWLKGYLTPKEAQAVQNRIRYILYQVGH